MACLMAFSVSQVMGSQYAMWSVVSAIVATQFNIADSLSAGVMRVVGTCIGALMSVVFLLFLPPSPFLLGLSVFLITSLFGYLARFSSVYFSAAIASMVVLLAGAQYLVDNYEIAISFGLLRVLEIVIGVGCALFISLVVWPVRLADTLRVDLRSQFAESAALLDTLLSAFLDEQRHLPESTLRNMEDGTRDNHKRLLKAHRHEEFMYPGEGNVMDVQVAVMDYTLESLHGMLEALNKCDEECHDYLIGCELHALGDAIIAVLQYLGGEVFSNKPIPYLCKTLLEAKDEVEYQFTQLRRVGATRTYHLHKVLQIFSFYHALRVLADHLLIALNSLQDQKTHGLGQ
jgi:uncharacterized membrane protein YgaE (UPF0421/DUF939 family)